MRCISPHTILLYCEIAHRCRHTIVHYPTNGHISQYAFWRIQSHAILMKAVRRERQASKDKTY
ncbi:protein of unknown function [Candidatus Methylomirabilis oxygeniifera]|uniref:Uncharacterized protein n=1 Tax=Methylomirabilis oxygeniifera TaxID=671143 RepID=D5ML07_METO1|nr:protein of unknown function [Candidatus Methylomirabilis oxyfera]